MSQSSEVSQVTIATKSLSCPQSPWPSPQNCLPKTHSLACNFPMHSISDQPWQQTTACPAHGAHAHPPRTASPKPPACSITTTPSRSHNPFHWLSHIQEYETVVSNPLVGSHQRVTGFPNYHPAVARTLLVMVTLTKSKVCLANHSLQSCKYSLGLFHFGTEVGYGLLRA